MSCKMNWWMSESEARPLHTELKRPLESVPTASISYKENLAKGGGNRTLEGGRKPDGALGSVGLEKRREMCLPCGRKSPIEKGLSVYDRGDKKNRMEDLCRKLINMTHR